jgi:hypothetical protein
VRRSRTKRRRPNSSRLEVIRLRDEDEIGDDVLRTIQQDLDLEEVLLSDSEWGDAPRREDDEAKEEMRGKDFLDARR